MKSILDLVRCLASLAIDALAVRQKACKCCLPYTFEYSQSSSSQQTAFLRLRTQ